MADVTGSRMEDRLRAKLASFGPTRLEIINESHKHAGHAGHDSSGESHFRVMIVASAFSGKSRLDRHRMVNAALADELANHIHALALVVLAPGEPGA